jgi:hypothetical protein
MPTLLATAMPASWTKAVKIICIRQMVRCCRFAAARAPILARADVSGTPSGNLNAPLRH